MGIIKGKEYMLTNIYLFKDNTGVYATTNNEYLKYNDPDIELTFAQLKVIYKNMKKEVKKNKKKDFNDLTDEERAELALKYSLYCTL